MPETFPAAINRLGRLVQEADGTLSETFTIPSSATYQHVLGTALTPPAMAGVPVIPRGAVPISPPAAPSVGVGNPVTGPGGLTPNSAYAWCLVNVTDYGETPAGLALVVSSIGAATSYRVGLPNPLEGTGDAPIRRRRLYRTAAGGSAAGPFGLVATLDELATTSYVDTLADIDGGAPPPTANTSGLPPVVTVTYVSGGVGALTEVVTGATLTTGRFSCDYSLSQTGGTLAFASGDAGRSVVVTYVAASLVNEALVATIVSGLQEMVAASGVAGGLATLNAQQQVIQDPASRGQPGGLLDVAHLPIDPAYPSFIIYQSPSLGVDGQLHVFLGPTAIHIAGVGAIVSSGATLTLPANATSYISLKADGTWSVSGSRGLAAVLCLYSVTTNATAVTGYNILVSSSVVGVAGGIAALNAQQQVVQPPATGVRQTIPLVNTADVWLDSGHQNSREPGNQADYISLFAIPITTSGGNIELRCSGIPWDNLGSGNWMALGVALDAGLVTQVDYSICSVAAGNAAFDHAVHADHLWLNVPAGAHTIRVLGQSGGGGPVPQASGFLGLTHPNTSPFHAVVSEIA